MSRALHRIKHAYSAERLLGVAVLGALGGLIAAQSLPVAVAILLGWDISALALLLWVWLVVGRYDAAATRQRATREDNNRFAIWVFLLAASTASLLGAGIALLRDAGLSQTDQRELLATCLVSVFLSWAVVQTVFTLRYAHEYYSSPEGGIDFGDEAPDYQDFAYFAITVGMTFQTSDAAAISRGVRRTVLRHAVLAYVFGTVILAVMVNVIASLVG
ncbi:MAG: DUF1345 domain-containing protein [Ilumatobacteraceae bacterium]